METVLTARDLTRHYEVSRGLFKGHAQVRALNGVSFELEAGKTLAVVGESGCGKSTLARALTLIEEPTSGSLKIAGQEVKGASKDQRRQLRRDVQMVFQNPYASLNPRQKIGDQLAEPLLINTALSREERREKVQQMMRQVGLRPEHYQRYPHMFSGGQRQRIALARAMMLQPKVLVADEPTSALDVSIQAQVLNLFMDLQQQFRTAYVFISHNLAVVRHVADDVLVMYLGRPAEMGPADKLYENPLHPYTRALLSATPAIHPDPTKPKIRIQGELPNPLNPPEGCAFHKRCPLRHRALPQRGSRAAPARPAPGGLPPRRAIPRLSATGRSPPRSPSELAQQRQPYPEPYQQPTEAPLLQALCPRPGRQPAAQAATGQRIGAVEGQANQNQDRTERGELDGQRTGPGTDELRQQHRTEQQGLGVQQVGQESAQQGPAVGVRDHRRGTRVAGRQGQSATAQHLQAKPGEVGGAKQAHQVEGPGSGTEQQRQSSRGHQHMAGPSQRQAEGGDQRRATALAGAGLEQQEHVWSGHQVNHRQGNQESARVHRIGSRKVTRITILCPQGRAGACVFHQPIHSIWQ